METLRERAARWRLAADTTRQECRMLAGVTELSWRGPSSVEFRRAVAGRLREMHELAEREDSVADLLDRLADAAERAA
ncbi:hypothetical protein LL946_11470 [Knoellia locipacati]|uniref:hypothetical protein n=1 Tax=Knoellia locipacati TaxID=882824 RepID=UPI00384FADBB